MLAEGFIEEPPRKELVIAFFVECFKATILSKSQWQILTGLWAILLKTAFPFFFVCVEGFVLDVPWKELISAPFVKRFKAATLRRSHWQILTVLLCYFIKDCIFLAVFFVEGFAQGTQFIFHDGGPYPIETSPLICRANSVLVSIW